MEQEAQLKLRRALGWTLSVSGAAALLVLLTVVSLIYRNPANNCLYAQAPEGALVSEAAQPSGRLSWIPLGLECTFPAATGGTIAVPPDPSLTLGAIGFFALFGVGLLLLIPIPPKPRSTHAAGFWASVVT
jgi:hypothetical protein